MRVAIVNQPSDGILPPYQTSIGIITYELSRRLATSFKVTVYIGGRSFKGKRYENGVVFTPISARFGNRTLLKRLNSYFKNRYSKKPYYSSKFYDIGYILRVSKDIRKQKSNIIHIYNFSQYIPIIKKFNPKVKIILHMQCDWLTQLDKDLIETRIDKVDLIIGCSEYITNKIKSKFPKLSDKCKTVYNGVDTTQFLKKSNCNSINDRKSKRLLFIGRISPEKGVHVLLDAYKNLASEFPNLRLDMVGPVGNAPFEFTVGVSDDRKILELRSFYGKNMEDSYYTKLKKLLPSDLMENVRFMGHIPQSKLINNYNSADVFVFPSLWHEPFGIPVIEAMACGVPVVATRSGGIAEIVQDGENGLLVERGNSEELGEAITRILQDDQLKMELSKKGRQRALDFSWEKQTKRLIDLYKELMEN